MRRGEEKLGCVPYSIVFQIIRRRRRERERERMRVCVCEGTQEGRESSDSKKKKRLKPGYEYGGIRNDPPLDQQKSN